MKSKGVAFLKNVFIIIVLKLLTAVHLRTQGGFICNTNQIVTSLLLTEGMMHDLEMTDWAGTHF